MEYSANVHMNYDCTASNTISRRRYFDKQIDWWILGDIAWNKWGLNTDVHKHPLSALSHLPPVQRRSILFHIAAGSRQFWFYDMPGSHELGCWKYWTWTFFVINALVNILRELLCISSTRFAASSYGLLNTVQIYISSKWDRSSSAPVQVTTFRSQCPHYLWFWLEYVH